MRKFQCFLFVLKPSCICYCIICMTTPLIMTSIKVTFYSYSNIIDILVRTYFKTQLLMNSFTSISWPYYNLKANIFAMLKECWQLGKGTQLGRIKKASFNGAHDCSFKNIVNTKKRVVKKQQQKRKKERFRNLDVSQF